MNLDGYFIAPDAHDELWIWRENGDYPQPVLSRHQLRDHPSLWDFIAAALKEKP